MAKAAAPIVRPATIRTPTIPPVMLAILENTAMKQEQTTVQRVDSVLSGRIQVRKESTMYRTVICAHQDNILVHQETIKLVFRVLMVGFKQIKDKTIVSNRSLMLLLDRVVHLNKRLPRVGSKMHAIQMVAIAQVPKHVNLGPKALRHEMRAPIVMLVKLRSKVPLLALRVQKESTQTRRVLCVQIAPLAFINRRKQNPVRDVLNALPDGNKKTKELRFALTPVASNLKIAATTNIGYPTNFPTKMKTPKPVVTIAPTVGRASVPLAKRASVRCSGGRDAPT